jgi:hypothetical protein
MRRVDERRLAVLPICLGLSLAPVLGAIPGILLYRFQLVAPYQRHIPPSHSLAARWCARGASFILLAFQWVPVVGGLALPLMAWINHAVYRRAFRRLAVAQAATPQPLAAPGNAPSAETLPVSGTQG